MSFIFEGDTGVSYADLQRRRAIADRLRGELKTTPKNVGEGIHAIAKALVARGLDKKNQRATRDLMNSGNPEVVAALTGLPAYKKGTPYHPGGPALVGEDGPEIVDLPKGSRVIPNLYTALPDEDDYFRGEMGADYESYKGMTREQKLEWLNDPQNGFTPPSMDEHPGGMFPWLDGNLDDSSFIPGAEYRTADMSEIPPSGVGETSQLNATARSFQGFMKSLQDYEEIFADGGATMMPGARRDQLATAHRDLQMQMKELYNLGVLNGPDLDLMNSILLNPTSVGGNIMDALGIADMEERIPANISEVRRMMTNRSMPALQQLGIDPNSLMPEKKAVGDMSDEDLLRALSGGGS